MPSYFLLFWLTFILLEEIEIWAASQVLPCASLVRNTVCWGRGRGMRSDSTEINLNPLVINLLLEMILIKKNSTTF